MPGRNVCKGEPYHQHYQKSWEFDSFCKRTDYQTCCDSGKSTLEGKIYQFRQIGVSRVNCIRCYFYQEWVWEISEEQTKKWAAVVTWRQRISVAGPQQIDQCEGCNNLHQDRTHIFGSNHSSVEKSYTRDWHQNNQHGTHYYESVCHQIRRRGFGRSCCGCPGTPEQYGR